MKTIYCISGMGADKRAFGKLQINDARLVELPWITPLKNETLEAYAARMRQPITEPDPILLGLSFGGIMSIEIAKQIPVSAIIIVSSIKTKKELPAWMRFVAASKLNRIFPMKSTRFTEPITNRTLGVTNNEEKAMVRDYRRQALLGYTNWAVNRVLNWKNEAAPAPICHIHGSKDRIFNIKNVKPTHIVAGGGHLMIMNRAEEISGIINGILQSF